MERCNLTGFDPRGHMWIEKNLPSCVRDTLLGEKGQALLYCAVTHFFNVFQTEIKLYDKNWGKLHTACFTLLYDVQASVCSLQVPGRRAGSSRSLTSG